MSFAPRSTPVPLEGRRPSARRRALGMLLLALLSHASASCAHSGASLEQSSLRIGTLQDSAPACASPRITFAGLLREMVDLECLTHLPVIPFSAQLASSHDRRSDRAQPGSPDWFANKDVVVLEESSATKEVPLLEVDGPGALTHLWSAKPLGRLRIYLDGASDPVIDADLAQLLHGELAPLHPPFAQRAGAGANLYFPIPFARGCRVTIAGEGGLYIQIDYRRYPTGTPIESYSLAAAQAARAVLSDVGERLAALRSLRLLSSDARTIAFELRAHAGAASTFSIPADPGGSTLLRLRVWPAQQDPSLLRATALVLEFDGEETVRCPLADCFAASPWYRPVASLPVTVSARASEPLEARWPMPFARTARVRLESSAGVALQARFEALVEREPFTDRTLLFHAHWRGPQTFASDPPRDWNVAAVEGSGTYVGTVLDVVNRAANWWGEGDEKVYVDGEAFPSRFGTGTEDYYGDAYCSNRPFTTAYLGQPLAPRRRNFGYITVYRFHILDRIPFRSALRFDLEVLHWGKSVEMSYAALALFYARPGAQVFPPAEPAQLRIAPLGQEPPPDVPEAEYRCDGSDSAP